MKDIFEQMLSRYPMDSADARRNATYEVLQQVVLSGLYRGGFFGEAAFYGGTCLRIFHGLDRFSEDMDFTLLRKDPGFSMERYFTAYADEIGLFDRMFDGEDIFLPQYFNLTMREDEALFGPPDPEDPIVTR